MNFSSTPARRAYAYPRALAATSPHERILERYRRSRLQAEQDVVVIESDGELAPGSESETSSEEIFAAPSPPAPAAPPASTPAICKSTSESDIYVRRKQQDKEGKENPDRSMSYRKPSKLPAPSSVKKPLIERNGAVN